MDFTLFSAINKCNAFHSYWKLEGALMQKIPIICIQAKELKPLQKSYYYGQKHPAIAVTE